MITIGIDDTDVLDSPGTNQLARHLVTQLAGRWRGRLITRHQLLDDPRIPCTRRNGCVAIKFDTSTTESIDDLAAAISSLMESWCPHGSDPGLCISSTEIPQVVIDFGLRCQREVVSQRDARQLAADCGFRLFGLGGTEDGVIGAVAAVGLMASGNDGRVIYLGDAQVDHFDISGTYPVNQLANFGVDEVRQLQSNELVSTGTVALGKRLRPNYRRGMVILFVSQSQHAGIDWLAERVL